MNRLADRFQQIESAKKIPFFGWPNTALITNPEGSGSTKKISEVDASPCTFLQTGKACFWTCLSKCIAHTIHASSRSTKHVPSSPLQQPQQQPPQGPQSGRPAVIVPALHRGEEISIAQWTTSPPPTSTTASTPPQSRRRSPPPPPLPERQHLKRPLRPQNNISGNSSSRSSAGSRKRRPSSRPRTPEAKKGRPGPPPPGAGAAKRVTWRDLERPAPTPPPVPPPPPPPHLLPLSIRSEEVRHSCFYPWSMHFFSLFEVFDLCCYSGLEKHEKT